MKLVFSRVDTIIALPIDACNKNSDTSALFQQYQALSLNRLDLELSVRSVNNNIDQVDYKMILGGYFRILYFGGCHKA